MKAVLGAFAVTRARERLGDLDSVLDAAMRNYRRRLGADPDFPPPPPTLAAALDPPRLEVEIELSPVGAALLEAESRRLGIETRLLLNHAVLLYLADLDRPRECHERKGEQPTLGK